MSFDLLYLLLVIPFLLGWLAQLRVRQTFYYYLKIPNKKGYTGAQIAEILLNDHKLNIPILETKKPLLNYYNPQSKTLHLSNKIAENPSITALGIVAHEMEHVVQDHQGWKYMHLRNNIAKLLAITGQLSPIFFLWGILFGMSFFIILSVAMLFGMTIFALISLPVELNASRRAIAQLKNLNLADQKELKMASRVLRNAALTYFAGASQRLGTFLFVVMILYMAHQL